MPGFGYGGEAPAPRSRRRDRESSSESRSRPAHKRRRGEVETRDRERERGDDRRDKKDIKKPKKDKRGEKDRRDEQPAPVAQDDRGGKRRQERDVPASDQRRSGRGGGHDREGKGGHDREDQAGTDSRRRSTGHGGKEQAPSPAGRTAQAAAEAAEGLEAASGTKPKKWKEELNEAEDARDLSDDDEAMVRKLEEAKKRREALKAKYASSKGEEPVAPAQAEEPQPPKEAEAAAGATSGGGAASGSAAGGSTAAAANGAASGGAASSTKGEKGEKAGDESPEAAGDMFDASHEASVKLKKGEALRSQAIGFTGASGEDWDDADGYYIPKLGEVMDDRYLVVESVCGKGVFSNVVKAKDQKAPNGDEGLVAIKVMRANDMMTKAAEKEVEILQRLNNADKRDKRHIIRLLSTFAYRRHFCLVFECMYDDMRAALKKYTKNKGMSLNAIRSYTQQLMVGLGHMRENGIIHADIKPDNILVSKGHQLVKFCDLGTAVEVKDVNPTPYLASRFYRPPEVILGCLFSFPVDMWAFGCTLYELFTGRTLITSKTNNDHLLKTMELRGKVPGKVVKKGVVWKTHFTDELDFKHEVEDPGSGQKVTKIITDFSTKTSIKDLVLDRVGKEKQQSETKEDKLYVTRSLQFADLLEHMLALDPDKRLSPEEGMAHAFLQEGVGKAAQAAAAAARR